MAGMVPLGRGVIMADEEVSGRVVLAQELGANLTPGWGGMKLVELVM